MSVDNRNEHHSDKGCYCAAMPRSTKTQSQEQPELLVRGLMTRVLLWFRHRHKDKVRSTEEQPDTTTQD